MFVVLFLMCVCVLFVFTFTGLVNLHFSNYSESHNIPNFQFLLATLSATQSFLVCFDQAREVQEGGTLPLASLRLFLHLADPIVAFLLI